MLTIRTLATVVAFAAAGAIAAPPAAECPQPRFTGKAPADQYERVNPLPAGADTGAAARIFRGDGRKVACATCHGEKGDGRGPLSGEFSPPPRNFRCAQTVNGIPDGQLFWIIRNGSPGTSMPAHPQLSDDDVWRMVLYIRQLSR